MLSNFFHPAKEEGHRVREMVASCVFSETPMHAKATNKSWSKSEGKGKSKKGKENPMGNAKGPSVPKVPKVRTRVNRRKTCLSGLQPEIRDKFRNSGSPNVSH